MTCNNMKYSNIFKCALPVVAGMLATSCTFEQEDYFDESASLRIEHTNQEIQKYLSAAPNGWVIKYFVAGTDDMSFEGFNLFGRFTETGKVTLSSDHRYLRNGNAGKYTEHTSVYEMLREESCVLSFSTWNDILSVFVDPVDPSLAPGTIADDGEGMHGDDRLVMLSYGPDEMVFRGERHSAKVYFSKLDCSPADYIAKVNSLKERIATSYVYEYSLSNADTTVYISGLSSGRFDIVDRLDDPLSITSRACTFTADGFFMENPYSLNGDSIQSFVVDADNTKLTSGNATLLPCWQRYVSRRFSANNAVNITAEGASSDFSDLYNQLGEKVEAAFSNQSFGGISFGRSNEGSGKSRTGLTFTFKTKKSNYIVAFEGTVSVDTNNSSVTINIDPTNYSTNYNSYDTKGLGEYFTAIAQRMSGTYSLTVDDTFAPKVASLVKEGDSNWSFQAILR